MRTRATPISAFMFVVVLVSGAWAYVEGDSVPEPWSGWWWPWYHDGTPGCRYCPHLWQGPGFVPSSPGPLYDLNTKYFWLSESTRTLAQQWEVSHHHTTQDSWMGHCKGVSYAQALASDPPTDCGALTQDDLEGLLAERYTGSTRDFLGGGHSSGRATCG
jgi:hypothetical protein